MWIELDRTHEDGRQITTSLKLPEMDEPVEFSENGKANVSAEIGELLTNEVESIEPSETDDDEEKTDDEEETIDDGTTY